MPKNIFVMKLRRTPDAWEVHPAQLIVDYSQQLGAGTFGVVLNIFT